MEKEIRALFQAGISVELLGDHQDAKKPLIGVRLRTFGRNLPKNMMVLGSGDTIVDALIDAIEKTRNRRWEPLDWAARPWPRPEPRSNGSEYGL